MASKRNIKLRQCAGHKPYEDLIHARNDAYALSRRMGTAVDAYRCKRCGFYHVGKRPARKNRAQRRA